MIRELRHREYGSSNSYTITDVKIMRKLIIEIRTTKLFLYCGLLLTRRCFPEQKFRNISVVIFQKSSSYKCIWKSISRKPIYFECGRIFMENFSCCFKPPIKSVCGLPKLYSVDTLFEDGICCDRTLPDIEVNDRDHNSCFLGISKKNWLHQLKFENGQLIQKIFLNSTVRFKHISWETEGESVVLKSSLKLRFRVRSPFLCAMAFFHVYPLRFIGMMKVEASVFGDDIIDASAMDKILIISHRKGFVRLYNLNEIMLNSTISVDNFNQQAGDLPFNIIIASRPPILFEFKCKRGDLQIGGFPWQLITPYQSDYQLTVLHSLDSTIIESTVNSIEPDQVMFHPNGSNRIVHITGTELRILKPNYKWKERELTLTTLCRLFPFQLPRHLDQIQVTRSGRIVKPSSPGSNAQIDSRSVLAFHYEHNLEMLCILFAVNNDNGKPRGQLALYDSTTNNHLTSIPFPYGVWKEDTTHSLDFDIDLIIHTSRSASAFHLQIYRFINSHEELF